MAAQCVLQWQSQNFGRKAGAAIVWDRDDGTHRIWVFDGTPRKGPDFIGHDHTRAEAAFKRLRKRLSEIHDGA